MICHQTEMYLSEVSPNRMRGRMSVVFCACVHIGVLLSFGVGPMLTVSSASGLYLVLVLLLAALYLAAAPETPFWLVKRARLEEALDSLRALRGHKDVHEEFEAIVEFVEKSTVATKSDGCLVTLARVFGSVANRKALLLVVLLTTGLFFACLGQNFYR